MPTSKLTPQLEAKILFRLQNKLDPLKIARELDVKISLVIKVMVKHPEVVPKRYRKILEMEDSVDQVNELMKRRRRISESIPANTIKIKLMRFLKKPRSSWEVIDHVKQTYRRLYGIMKSMGVVKVNPLSPLSLDLLLLKRYNKKLDKEMLSKKEIVESKRKGIVGRGMLKWRKQQITDMQRKHKGTIQVTQRFAESEIRRKMGPIEFAPYFLEEPTFYLEIMGIDDYPHFVSPIHSYFTTMERQFIKLTLYQQELWLGDYLRRGDIDLVGFPKDSIYYSDNPGYPLFIINNHFANKYIKGFDKQLRFQAEKIKTSKYKAREEISDLVRETIRSQTPQTIQQSFNLMLTLFEPDSQNLVRDLCWKQIPIVLELMKYVVFYAWNYLPPTRSEMIKEAEGNIDVFNDIKDHVFKQSEKALFWGLVSIGDIELDTIIDALFFSMDRYPFAFYLLCRIFGIPTYENHSDYFKKRMKAREPKIYEQEKGWEPKYRKP